MGEREDGADQAGRSVESRISVVARFEAAAGGIAAVTGADQELLAERLCRVVVEVLGVDGAAISVYLGADIAVPIGASDLDATTGEALQFTLREGPCFESYSTRAPVLIPDIERPDCPVCSRWATYADQLGRRTPFKGVFAYPLLSGRTVMGSLSLYQRGVAAVPEVGDVSGIGAWIGARLLGADIFTGPGPQVEHRWMNGRLSRRRSQVWIAQGLTVAANGVSLGEALELLRAAAFSADRLLDDLAADIVTGRVSVPVLEPE